MLRSHSLKLDFVFASILVLLVGIALFATDQDAYAPSSSDDIPQENQYIHADK
ncbi:hypothetical protein SAMN02745116_01987 [Pilibacter termitis]|uniref:Uncharacterized protein n=1 Tax=Pilibacter termitis TaxID=263852 RepID=A0A1T4PZ90_9ENTE|nr:hypothetical protein [Pilibacter termitis]SJZ96666.1 hypothetical protein SAMN02745116_01987 [Pilibacter termitis]